MAKKEFLYHGKNIEELKALSLQEFSQLTPARLRRTIKRGFTEEQKIFLNKLKRSKRSFKTHCRDMVILPEMVGKTIDIHNGNKFVSILIEIEMLVKESKNILLMSMGWLIRERLVHAEIINGTCFYTRRREEEGCCIRATVSKCLNNKNVIVKRVDNVFDREEVRNGTN